MKKVVSDTGALISLEKLQDGYTFIQRLYDKIIIPPAVLEEVAFHFPNGREYLKLYGIERFIEVREASCIADVPGIDMLDVGEVQAIYLALELKKELLIEERDGRRVAKNAGLQISGIAGQVLKALERGLIGRQEALDKLGELFRNRRLDRRSYEELRGRV